MAEACAELDALVPTDGVRTSLAAHAPYSVAPLVLRAIRTAVDRDPFAPYSIHLSEGLSKRSSSFAAAAVHGASCSRSSDRGIPRGCRRDDRRSSFSTNAGFSAPGLSRRARCADDDGRP